MSHTEPEHATERVAPYTEVRGTRIALFCPREHEVVSAPLASATGQRLAAENYSGEECGHACDWSAS